MQQSSSSLRFSSFVFISTSGYLLFLPLFSSFVFISTSGYLLFFLHKTCDHPNGQKVTINSRSARKQGVYKLKPPRPVAGMNESVISLRLTLPSISSKEKAMVIEISSSSFEEESPKNMREGEKRGRKRRYPDVEMKTKEEKRGRKRRYPDVEMKTKEEKWGRKRRYPDVEMKTKEKWREDEDCCILSFDSFAVDLNEKLSVFAAHSQLDDLTIVAERGQVARRDFPHSRHLCAEYPFNKTPHESCCLKCYCYVCEEDLFCKKIGMVPSQEI